MSLFGAEEKPKVLIVIGSVAPCNRREPEFARLM